MSTRPAGDDGQWPADDRLSAVFRAATAPAHTAELAGEDAAMAAFRAAAVTETATGSSRPSTVRNVLAKVLTVKAMVVLAVAGSAGIVVAATGGVLPTPWSAPQTEQRPATPAPAPTETARTTGSAPAPSAGTAAPEIVDLCQKYLHRGRQDKALDEPAFEPLVDAAGGAEKVPAYCATHADDPRKPGKATPPDSHGNGPGDHGRPDNPGTPASPSVPGNNGNNGNSGNNGNPGTPGNNGNPGTPADPAKPTNPPAREPKETEPRKPESAAKEHAPAATPGKPARQGG